MEATDDRGFRDHGREQLRRGGLPAAIRQRRGDHTCASRCRALLAISRRAHVTYERIFLSAGLGGGDFAETAPLPSVPAHDDPSGTEQSFGLFDGELQSILPQQLLQRQPGNGRRPGLFEEEREEQESGVEGQIAAQKVGEAVPVADDAGGAQQSPRHPHGDLQPPQHEQLLQGQSGAGGGKGEHGQVEEAGEEQDPGLQRQVTPEEGRASLSLDDDPSGSQQPPRPPRHGRLESTELE